MSAVPRGRRAVEANSAAATPEAVLPTLAADYAREQFAMAMEASAAFFGGLDAMRRIQQRAAQLTSARHRDAAKALRHTATPSDLMVLPFELWRSDCEAAAGCWQELAGAALEAQTQALGAAIAHVADSETALAAVAAVDTIEKTVPGAGLLVPPVAAIRRRARKA